MEPQLYEQYSRESALGVFGSSSERVSYLRGNFVVLDKVVACLFDLGPQRGASFDTSRRIVWRPERELDAQERGLDWWPPDVVDTFDRAGVRPIRKRRHHLFVRRAGATYRYLGPAHLASHSADGTASFELETRVPRALWLLFGGYSGWRVELNHLRRELASDDLEGLLAELTRFASAAQSHLTLTRYEEDELHLFKNEHHAWMMYLRDPGDSGLYVKRAEAEPNPRRESFRCDCGIDFEVPSHQTLATSEAVSVAAAFFENGKLPKHSWTDDFPG